jgi:hypothetical protein
MPMMKYQSLLVVAALLLPVPVYAQNSEGAASCQIRTIFHDPVNPAADLFVPDKAGNMAKLEFIPASLSNPQAVRPVNGSLVLYKTATVDPKNPQESVAATVKLPENLKRLIVIVLPGPANSNPPYRMVVIDDSNTGFPRGESRVVSLLPVETAIEAGEHKLPVNPGKVTNLPVVTKVNEFNMAQTNFYFKKGETWVAFTERQLQFLNEFRRIFIVHLTPGATFPIVTTIVDTAPPVVPKG